MLKSASKHILTSFYFFSEHGNQNQCMEINNETHHDFLPNIYRHQQTIIIYYYWQTKSTLTIKQIWRNPSPSRLTTRIWYSEYIKQIKKKVERRVWFWQLVFENSLLCLSLLFSICTYCLILLCFITKKGMNGKIYDLLGVGRDL